MKRYLALVCFMLASIVGHAQYTTGTGIITDTAGTNWVGATVTATFYPAPNFHGQYTWNGTQQYTFAPVIATANGSASFSIQVPDNSLISPSNTMWTFTFCPLASTVCSTSVPVSMVGGSVSLTTLATTTITPPSINPTEIQYAYNDNEVLPMPGLGQLYYRTSDLTLREWNGTAWVSAGGGGGTGNVGAGTTGQIAQYPANGTNVQGATISGDATLAPGGALTLSNSGVVSGSYNFPSTVVVDTKGRVTSINGNTRVNGCVFQYRIVDYSGSGTVIPDTCPDTTGAPNNGTLATAAPTIGSLGALFLPVAGSGTPQTITTPIKNWGALLVNFCTWPRGQLNSLSTTTTGTAIGGFTANAYPSLWGASSTQGYQILANYLSVEVVGPWGFSSSGFSAKAGNWYGGCHTMVYQVGSPGDTIYMDGNAVALAATGSGTTHTLSTTNYSIGGWTDLTQQSGFRGWINYVKAWPSGTTLTAAQVLAESQSVSQEVSNRQGYPLIPSFNTGSRVDTVICGGDSLVAGYNGITPWCVPTYVPTNHTYTFLNYALGGQFALEVAGLFGQQLAPAISPSSRTIVINDAASNDVRGGLTPADTFNSISQLTHTLATSGALFIQDTMISRGTFDTQKNTLNAFTVKNWRQLGISALNDVAEIAVLGADGANSNINCFQADQIHLQGPGNTPNCANGHSGYSIYAQAHADTINYLDGSTNASPTVVSSYPFAMDYSTVWVSATTCPSGTCVITLPGCDHMDDMPFYVMNYGNAGTVTVGPPTSSYYQSTGYNLNGGTSAVTVPANTTMKFNELRGSLSAGGCSWLSE